MAARIGSDGLARVNDDVTNFDTDRRSIDRSKELTNLMAQAVLLKSLRDQYRRYLMDPASDPVLRGVPAHEQVNRIARNQMLVTLIENAQPFVFEEAAVDLIATLSMNLRSAADLGPLLLEAPLPFPNTWFEYQDDLNGDAAGKFISGVLIRKMESRIFACSFHKLTGRSVMEPVIFFSFEEDGTPDMVLNPHTTPAMLEEFQGSREERINQLFGAALPRSAWALVTAVRTMHLMAAKGGPLDGADEPMFSRQERRRMERDGELPQGRAPTVTRIRINEQGRLHLQAIDEEEGGVGGTRRRAHRVRGHFMQTTKGSSWRRAHVRGLGSVNETVRVVGVKGIGMNP